LISQISSTRALKALAALQGKSIKQYALERRLPQQADDEQAWQELKALVGERIASDQAGQVSAKGFDAIVDEELGRADRT